MTSPASCEVNRARSRWLLSFAGAVVGIFCFQPFAWWWLVPPAWFLILFGMHQTSPRVGFVVGLLSGTVLFGGTLSWLWVLFSVFAIPLWMILAGFLACFAYFYRAASTARRK
jgi:apolipoprotein N-acyltransferase